MRVAASVGRVILMDDTDTPTAEITGVYLRPVDPRMVALPLAQKIFDTEWVESSSRLNPAERCIGCARGKLAAVGRRRRRDKGTRGGIRDPVQLTDSAGDQRRVVG